MKLFLTATLLLISQLVYSKSASPSDTKPPMVTVPEGANWVLLGEWDFPGNGHGKGPDHYTRSIIELNGKHFSVSDGTLIAGFGFWPTAYVLEEKSAKTFLDPSHLCTYIINEDGTLTILEKNGTSTTVNPTPRETRFSGKWR